MYYTPHTAYRKRNNQNARNRNAHNDVINQSNPNKAKQHAFCHLHATKQPPFFLSNKLPNKKLIPTHINQKKLYFKNWIHDLTKNYKSLQETDQKLTPTQYSSGHREKIQGNKQEKMERRGQPTSHPTNQIATQTKETSNIGHDRLPLTGKQHFDPFLDIDYNKSPDYLKHLYKVFGENFIAEATRSDPQNKNLLQIIEQKNKDTLKHYSRYWQSLNRDLSTTPTGCILYDGKHFIPTQLSKLVMNLIHRNHPGQSGVMHLANLIWFPRIHREIVILTQNVHHASKSVRI